ncbi:MAG: hypothetical protein EAZ55_09235 [Cytophagales bacterium]|nr:MAG: hypothetical protein EAZ55_09235 [Cytophagales bacterium]
MRLIFQLLVAVIFSLLAFSVKPSSDTARVSPTKTHLVTSSATDFCYRAKIATKEYHHFPYRTAEERSEKEESESESESETRGRENQLQRFLSLPATPCCAVLVWQEQRTFAKQKQYLASHFLNFSLLKTPLYLQDLAILV